jgi:uncharacterized protein YfaS (alpha-2-macroglobulin family)
MKNSVWYFTLVIWCFSADVFANNAYDSADSPEQNQELQILRITPNGDDVRAGQQVVFTFDRKVVPVGAMDRKNSEIPISITPKLNCEWRWLNTSSLACQLLLEDTMLVATHYKVLVKPGIKTESGLGMKTSKSFSFTTQRPKVTYMRFVNWLGAGEPLMQITFNQPVTKSSVEKSLKLIPDSRVDQASNLEIFPDNMAQQLPSWMQAPAPAKPDDQLTKLHGEDARRVWLIKSSTVLSLDTEMSLTISPGLISAYGREPGIENRTVITFNTFPEFKFLGVRCIDFKSENWLKMNIAELTENVKIDNADSYRGKGCSPTQYVSLAFTVPVLNSVVRNHVTLTPALNKGLNDYDPWKNSSDNTYLAYAHRPNQEYQVTLPEYLKAYQQYDLSIDLTQFKDEFGRNLVGDKNKFRFFTTHRPPEFYINHPFAVLEKNIDTDVPLYVTNIDSATASYDKVTTQQSSANLSTKMDITNIEDVAYAIPMQVRNLIPEKSGIISGVFSATPKPNKYYRDREFFVQVTPFQVHAKFGHFSSLVWVTDLSTGKSVENAKVSLVKGHYRNIVEHINEGIGGVTNESGIIEMAGYSEFDPELKVLRNWHRQLDDRYFLRVEKDDDIALLPLDGYFLVRDSNSWSSLQRKHGHASAWGTTAQGVYKLGDKIEFKIYLRDQSNKKWIVPRKEKYSLKVYDPQGKAVHEKTDIQLSEFGAFDGSFKVAQQGAIGWYRFELTADYTKYKWTPLTVLVSDFTPSPFKVKTELNGEQFKAGDTLKINASSLLHSGGPYTNANVRLTARLSPKAYTSINPAAKSFTFGSFNKKTLTELQTNLLDRLDKMNNVGEFSETITLPEADVYFGSLMVEAAVMDDRGKYVAASKTVEYSGRDRFVGLKNTRWIYNTNKQAAIELLVLDNENQLSNDVVITVKVKRHEYKVARVKGPGNAYLTKNISQWLDVSSCEIKSKRSAVKCNFTPEVPGSYQFIASIKDSNGREHQTTIYGWVVGDGYVSWEQSNDASLAIIAEQNSYKVGANARYLVKNPYPGTKALITIERYGVLDSWVQDFKSSTPIIEFPIKADYLPGFYLSVVVLSPRVDKPLGKGKVDLGKPAYRMGYISANVSDPYKQLEVTIKTNKQVYKPRDKIKATIHVSSKHNKTNAPYEIAVAVVDESVLALNLKGKNYYDPYSGFNKLDTLDLNNYSLISRLVGKQKFEKKGANTGGDGGGAAYSTIRNLFKFVSYWNPAITPDENGNATIEFDAPDNLTGWRILAWAVTPDDMMGLGDSNYKVSRATEIRPVMPNQVIEGDKFKAGFSIMNRTDKQRKLEINISVKGALDKNSNTTLKKTVVIAAYQKSLIWFPIKTKGFGVLDFVVRAKDKIDGDGLEHQVPVNKRRSLETAATYGTTTNSSIFESIKIPKDIYTDVGGVSVVLAPSVIGNIDGAFKYVKSYPYFCWEQRITKAVMASSYLELQEYLKNNIEWQNARGEVEDQLFAAANFQAPNGGMTYWVSNNEYVSPYLSAYTAVAFNWLRRDGYEIPKSVEDKLHDYLNNLIRQDVFPSFYSKGMSSSVRAVALAALAEHKKVNKSDITRYLAHVPEMDLFGRSFYLQAAIKVGDTKAIVNKVLNSILGHVSQTGGKVQFNETWDDSYKYMLATPLRSNCSILSSLLVAQQQSPSAKQIADIPFKLVRSITQTRGNRDHWENTQENVFCMNAIVDYSNLYESQDPDFKIEVKFDNKKIGSTQFTKKSDSMVEIKRAMQQGDDGKKANVEILKTGSGRVYYSARLAYDLKEDNRTRINSGIEVRREYSVERQGKWSLLNSPMKIKRGELIRVDLFVSVPTARHFVVLNDPVPGGLEPVNTDLATASVVDANKSNFKASSESWWFKRSNWSNYGRFFWSFYHKELRHDSARFYADYLPAGNYHLSYSAQAIAEGDFSVMPTHIEEMYDPDVYGKGLPMRLNVGGLN